MAWGEGGRCEREEDIGGTKITQTITQAIAKQVSLVNCAATVSVDSLLFLFSLLVSATHPNAFSEIERSFRHSHGYFDQTCLCKVLPSAWGRALEIPLRCAKSSVKI